MNSPLDLFIPHVKLLRVRKYGTQDPESYSPRNLATFGGLRKLLRDMRIGHVKTKYATLLDLSDILDVSTITINKWYKWGYLPTPFLQRPMLRYGKTIHVPIYIKEQVELILAAYTVIEGAGYRNVTMNAHKDLLQELHTQSDKCIGAFRLRLERRNGTRSLNEVPIEWHGRSRTLAKR